MYSSDEEDDIDKPPSAFAAPVLQAIEDDRQPVGRDSDYTAFWLGHGLPLSSQYRQGLQVG